jgi:AraC-like DNA-binding protein
LLTNYHQRTVVLPAEITEEEPVEDMVERTGNAPGDMEWLARLEELVQQSMGQFDMNAEALAAQMFTSRSQLFRKVKQITGLSLNEYIQEIRFHQARMLLEQKKYTTVKAVALSVGFKHTNHFAISYKKRFGKSPTDYFL